MIWYKLNDDFEVAIHRGPFKKYRAEMRLSATIYLGILDKNPLVRRISKDSDDSKNDSVLWQYRYKEQNSCCCDFNTWGPWQNITFTEYKKIKSYIESGYKYEVRKLVVKSAVK